MSFRLIRVQWVGIFVGNFSRRQDDVEMKSIHYLWAILYGISTYLVVDFDSDYILKEVCHANNMGR